VRRCTRRDRSYHGPCRPPAVPEMCSITDAAMSPLRHRYVTGPLAEVLRTHLRRISTNLATSREIRVSRRLLVALLPHVCRNRAFCDRTYSNKPRRNDHRHGTDPSYVHYIGGHRSTTSGVPNLLRMIPKSYELTIGNVCFFQEEFLPGRKCTRLRRKYDLSFTDGVFNVDL
jgi:hypothetical protein